jgi:hypothetical protein
MIRSKECDWENCSNPRFSHGYCKYHQDKRTDSKYTQKKSIKTKNYYQKSDKTPTGEGAFLVALINSKPNVDFVTGEQIDDMTVYNCHHVLTKAAYPKFRTFDKNIVFLSNDNHDFIHSIALSDLIAQDDRWQKYQDLQISLKEMYYDGR